MWGFFSLFGAAGMAVHENYQINNSKSMANRDTRASLERIGYYNTQRALDWSNSFKAEVIKKEGTVSYEAAHFMTQVFECISKGGRFETAYQKYLPEYEKALREREENRKWHESLAKPVEAEPRANDIDKQLDAVIAGMTEEEKQRFIETRASK